MRTASTSSPARPDLARDAGDVAPALAEELGVAGRVRWIDVWERGLGAVVSRAWRRRRPIRRRRRIPRLRATPTSPRVPRSPLVRLRACRTGEEETPRAF